MILKKVMTSLVAHAALGLFSLCIAAGGILIMEWKVWWRCMLLWQVQNQLSWQHGAKQIPFWAYTHHTHHTHTERIQQELLTAQVTDSSHFCFLFQKYRDPDCHSERQYSYKPQSSYRHKCIDMPGTDFLFWPSVLKKEVLKSSAAYHRRVNKTSYSRSGEGKSIIYIWK